MLDSRQSQIGRDPFTPKSPEDAALDAALADSDDLLTQSLQKEDRVRQKARRVGLLASLLVMGTAAMLFVPAERGVAADAVTLTTEGWQLWQQRKLKEAEAKFEKAVKLDPEVENAWNGLGWARFNQGKQKEALEAFEKCIQLVPEHPAAQNGLGQIYFSRREYDKAEKHFKMIASQADAASWGLGKLYLLKGRFEEALPIWERIAAVNPTDESVKPFLAAAKSAELSDELRQLIEPPNASERAAFEGWRLFNTGQLAKAQDAFKKVLEDDPKNLSALNGLGFCLLNGGEPAEAKKHFKQCLKLEPEAAGPMNGLARCLKTEGKVDEAIEVWEQMVEKSSEPNAGHSGLAYTYLEQKKYDKAVTYFAQLVAANPQNAQFKSMLDKAKAGLKESRKIP